MGEDKMVTDRSHEIQEIIDRESRAFDTADVELMLSVYHPDMVWAWPPHSRAYDPMDWIMRMGRFDYDRWYKLTQLFFDTHTLVHNTRVTHRGMRKAVSFTSSVAPAKSTRPSATSGKCSISQGLCTIRWVRDCRVGSSQSFEYLQ